MDSGASHPMTRSRDLFTSISEGDSKMHVEYGVDTKHSEGSCNSVIPARVMRFFEGGMLYVSELKMNLLSVSTLEDKGFVILFQNGHVLIYSEGASPNTQ